MYHVTVRSNGKVISEAFTEGLADAVFFGMDSGQKGNRITIYDSLQDASGETVDLHKVLSTVVTE